MNNQSFLYCGMKKNDLSGEKKNKNVAYRFATQGNEE